MKKCLHQIFKPSTPLLLVKNRGDCSICETDKKNEVCGGYTPVSLQMFEVNPREMSK